MREESAAIGQHKSRSEHHDRPVVAQGGQNGAPNAGPMYRGARDRPTDIACANRGFFGSAAVQNERSYYRGRTRQSVPEPESRPFLGMAAEIDAESAVSACRGLAK